MPETVCAAEFHGALADSVEEVLYKMFFIEAGGGPAEAPVAAAPDEISAVLRFEGRPSGSLRLTVARTAARSIAADFLAEDESALSARQVGDVVCELANMICGAMLSRVEREESFRLSTPRIIGAGETREGVPPTASHVIGIGRGTLQVAVYAEAP